MTQLAATNAGERAEARVLDALHTLPAPWQIFSTVEWRLLNGGGESIGEADAVVFHPQFGLAVFEIKAGAVEVRNGQWFYSSGLAMKQSPFAQARRNRYALVDKLRQRLGKDSFQSLGITHAVWFPDVVWHGPLPGTEAPSRAFLFDHASLGAPEKFLLKMWREAAPHAAPWTKNQQNVVKELLAPDCHLLVPLVSRLSNTAEQMHQATTQQINALRLLRTQSRLLVEGGAGSGKTLLAVALAREHAAQGKRVLLTCFNINLANKLTQTLANVSGVSVQTFHNLTKAMALAAGLDFSPPTEPADQAHFYREECPEILLNAAEICDEKFDSIIVDEAFDFLPTWWVALAELGAANFSWYCFFDRHQALYLNGESWTPPFAGTPLPLDINLRNTRAIGELAAKLGRCPVAGQYLVEQGEEPIVVECADFADMAEQLRKTLKVLIDKEGIAPERIVVLSPYRHSNPKSAWKAGLDEVRVSNNMATETKGMVRAGTIQGFKGLEADIVILVGLDGFAQKRPEWLYVGASRAKAGLYLLQLQA